MATAYGILGTVRLRGRPNTPWADEWAVNTFHFAGTTEVPLALNAPQQAAPTFGVDFESKSRVIQVGGADVLVEQGFKGDALPGVFPVFTDADWDALAGELLQWRRRFSQAWGYMLQDVRLYPLNPDGTAVDKWVNIYTPAGLDFDDSDGLKAAPQTAVVFSHYSPTRTRKGRGRVYFPGPSIADPAGPRAGLIQQAHIDDYVAGHKAFLDAVRAIKISQLNPQRFTPVIFNRGLNPTVNVINRVRVGDEFDTQQRRRRQRVEQYTDANLA